MKQIGFIMSSFALSKLNSYKRLYGETEEDALTRYLKYLDEYQCLVNRTLAEGPRPSKCLCTYCKNANNIKIVYCGDLGCDNGSRCRMHRYKLCSDCRLKLKENLRNFQHI